MEDEFREDTLSPFSTMRIRGGVEKYITLASGLNLC